MKYFQIRKLLWLSYLHIIRKRIGPIIKQRINIGLVLIVQHNSHQKINKIFFDQYKYFCVKTRKVSGIFQYTMVFQAGPQFVSNFRKNLDSDCLVVFIHHNQQHMKNFSNQSKLGNSSETIFTFSTKGVYSLVFYSQFLKQYLLIKVRAISECVNNIY